MKKEFTSAKDLLPSVLAKISRESGRAAHLGVVWADVVGAVTAKHTEPLALDGATLRLRVESPRWREAIAGQEAAILARLCERLGSDSVKRFQFVVVEPK